MPESLQKLTTPGTTGKGGTKRNALAQGLLLALAAVLIMTLAAVGLMRSPLRQSSSGAIWFGDIRGPLSISTQDEEALVRSVGEGVMRGGGAEIALPQALREDKEPRIVFVSVSDGRTAPRVVPGSGLGLSEALANALAQAISGGNRPAWVKLDIVQQVILPQSAEAQIGAKLERSLYGLAYDRESGVAFLPEELVANTLLDSQQNIKPANIEAYLARRSTGGPAHQSPQPPQNRGSGEVYRFTTVSSFYDGRESVRLYRGHRPFDTASREDLLAAARLGGAYLTAAVGPDGKFVYRYLAETDSVGGGYNILRHAGSTYSMLELYDVTSDAGLLQAAQRAIGYLLRAVKPCSTTPGGAQRDNGMASCVVEDGEVKLGGNALAVIALAKYAEVTGDRQYVPVMLDLGRWIRDTQSESGEFTMQKVTYPEGKVDDFVSEYYPGEAMLALVRLYALDRDEAWLDRVEASASYLINVRDGAVPDIALPQDHWLLYSLNELYRYRPDPLYLKQTLRLAKVIMTSQNDGAHYPDWSGGFYRPPRSTPAATRNEGLCAAYSLAADFGYKEEAEEILGAMWRTAAFQLRTQLRPESAMYLTNPQRALGGFRESLTDFEVRIDYVQHNISSLLCLSRVAGDSSGND